jgi:hypothetical protein
MRRMILACSVLLALSTGATAGQIYKWVDGQGNVHFGSQPPEGQEAAAVNPNIAQPKLNNQNPAPATEAKQSEQDVIDEKVKREVAKQEAERKKFCEATRYNLAQLKNNPRARIEVEGEVRRLSEEERQAQISENEKAISEHCQ